MGLLMALESDHLENKPANRRITGASGLFRHRYTTANTTGRGLACHLGIQKTLSGMAGKTESNQGRKNRL